MAAVQHQQLLHTCAVNKQRDIEEVKHDVETIMARYDKNHDGVLENEDLATIKHEYKSKKESLPAAVLTTLAKYDNDHDGDLDSLELSQIVMDIKTTDTVGRYAAYTGLLGRAARYLAYTSDIGEAFRPIAHPRLVTASYGVSWAYCGADVLYETWKLKQQGANDRSLMNMAAERSVFQAVASMACPAITINTTVRIFKHVFKRVGRYQRWGPTFMGLAVIPFLPMIYDKPVEEATEHIFHHYWPWRQGAPTSSLHARMTLGRTATASKEKLHFA